MAMAAAAKIMTLGTSLHSQNGLRHLSTLGDERRLNSEGTTWQPHSTPLERWPITSEMLHYAGYGEPCHIPPSNSNIRRMKVLPGGTTLLVWPNFPTRDSSSLLVHDSALSKTE